MIKLENTEVMGWEHAIRGMRNPLNSWSKSDSYYTSDDVFTDEDGNVRVYASVFKPDAEPLELLPVETEREWKIIETILDSIQEENKKNSEESN